jgi:GTP pyrophosphokinase
VRTLPGCGGDARVWHDPGRRARRPTAEGDAMDLGELERQLAGITLAPYIVRAMRLIDIPRKSCSNMFRHQMGTLAILLDYKFTDPVLLKASVIHDLFELADGLPGVTREAIECIDADGPAVYQLVQEVSIRKVEGVKEPKPVYLTRVMEAGTERARRLKLADRISNLVTLGFVNDLEFVERYLIETRTHILPHAAAVNEDMHRELRDLVENREGSLLRWRAVQSMSCQPG